MNGLVERELIWTLAEGGDNPCERRDIDGLKLLSLMCRRAVERGKQLWPIGERIALMVCTAGQYKCDLKAGRAVYPCGKSLTP